jgi:hypothetical protein
MGISRQIPPMHRQWCWASPMNQPSSPGDKGHIALAGILRPMTGPTRSAAHRKQEHRRALTISCGILSLAVLCTIVVIETQPPMSAQSLQSPRTASEMHDLAVQTGKITNASDANGCFQQQFDNMTGRMTRSQEPCETFARDGNGVPIPVGTIHRLDAISRSFSGR